MPSSPSRYRFPIVFSLLVGMSLPAGLWAAAPWTSAEGVLESCTEPAPTCQPAVGRTLYLTPSPRLCRGVRGSYRCPYLNRRDALAALQPGDTLVFMAGAHDVKGGWTIEHLHGTPCAPIRLRASSGAVFSAELAATEWRRADTDPDGQPFPAGMEIFEAFVDNPGPKGVGLFLEMEELGQVALPPYPRLSDFLSTNTRFSPLPPVRYPACTRDGWVTDTTRPHDGTLGLYAGPGFYAEPQGNRIRLLLRLEPTRTTELQGLDLTPVDLDRRLHPFALDSTLQLQLASYLALEGWNLDRTRGMVLGGGAHHIDILDLKANGLPGSGNLVSISSHATAVQQEACRVGPCHLESPEICPTPDTCECSTGWHNTCFAFAEPPHHLRIRRAHLDAGFPPWLFWTDMKSGSGFPAEDGVCDGWSYAEGVSLGTCDCEDLGPAPEGPVFRIAHNSENPGNVAFHGSLLGISRTEHSPLWDRPYDPYCILLEQSKLEDAWFGVYGLQGQSLRFAGNTLLRMHNDAFVLSDRLDATEVAHNEIRGSLSSFSSVGSDTYLDTGDVYIHHNVVDNSDDGPPAAERIACVSPGDPNRFPEWNHFDIDGDGEGDGLCTGMIHGGHTDWGMRWHVYANTLLVDNAMPAGALGTVKQTEDHPEPAYFVGNILQQFEPNRPLYGSLFYSRFGDGGACREQPLGLQITDGNLYWRTGDTGLPESCGSDACCAALPPAPPDLGHLFSGLSGLGGTYSYSSLAHFQCGVATAGSAPLADLSSCGYDLQCLGCEGEPPGVNEGRSVFRDPGATRGAGYRPAGDVEARVRLPRDWPDSDWPWIGARAPQMGEDCVPFDPVRLTVEPFGIRYRLMDGLKALLVFDVRADALKTRDLLRFHGADQLCYVGRPGPSLRYVLAHHRAPSGEAPGESCRSFSTDRLRLVRRGPTWLLVEGSAPVFSFPTGGEAQKALEIIRGHRFRHVCTVGAPNPSFSYLRR
ncbi:MAG: hypothetical protein AAGD06_11445 [Acidobacteriota bacterium]